MKFRLLFYFFIITILTSCAHKATIIMTKGSYVKLIPSVNVPIVYSEEKASKIKVFYKKKPDFKFIEIGIIEAIAYGGDVGLKDLFAELRKQAVLVGGQAIYKIQLIRHNQTGDTLQATAVAVNPK